MYFYAMIANKNLKRFTYSCLLATFVAFLVISCSGNMSDEGTDVVTFLRVSSSESSTVIGKTIHFSATDNLNNDVTSTSEFYVNGILNETGASYTPTKSGKFEVVAKMNGLASKPLALEVTALSGVNFVHRILYEDYTGTWCGNCPLAVVRYENLVKQNENVVLLGIHGPQGSGDPYINPTSNAIIKSKKVYGFPTILINGKYSWTTSDNNYTDMSFPLQYLKPSSKIGISANTTLSGNTLDGEVKVSFAEGYQNLKMAIYVVENDLHYAQHNYFNGTGGKPIFYEGLPIIENYTHHNVVRDNITAVDGEVIPSTQSTENTVFSKPISYNVPSEYIKENTKLVIVIMDKDGAVLNTREVVINTNNDLEIIE